MTAVKTQRRRRYDRTQDSLPFFPYTPDHGNPTWGPDLGSPQEVEGVFSSRRTALGVVCSGIPDLQSTGRLPLGKHPIPKRRPLHAR